MGTSILSGKHDEMLGRDDSRSGWTNVMSIGSNNMSLEVHNIYYTSCSENWDSSGWQCRPLGPSKFQVHELSVIVNITCMSINVYLICYNKLFYSLLEKTCSA